MYQLRFLSDSFTPRQTKLNLNVEDNKVFIGANSVPQTIKWKHQSSIEEVMSIIREAVTKMNSPP